jgi:hypothetical protein
VKALIHGDRNTAFDTLRTAVQKGGNPEQLLTKVVCALDDAHKSRVEGGQCNPEIMLACEGCETSRLEQLVSSLTTAVDSRYSAGITAAKLALARAFMN